MRSVKRLWLAALMLAGCGGKSSAKSGVDAAMLAKPAELERLFAQPAAPLGARHFEASSSLEMTPAGRPAEALRETFRLDADARGQMHLLHENDHDDGLEAIVVAGRLYVRPRYGKFVMRRAEPDEMGRLRGNVEGVAAGYLRLLGPWVDAQVTGSGPFTVKLGLRASPDESLREHDASNGRAWRDGVTVTKLDGEFTVDGATGLPLDGRIDAVYTFARSDLPGVITATLRYAQKSTTAPEAIAAPNEVVTLKRPRPLLDRQTLLEGLKN